MFIHQCILLMWQKKKQQQSVTSDVVYENTSKTQRWCESAAPCWPPYRSLLLTLF